MKTKTNSTVKVKEEGDSQANKFEMRAPPRRRAKGEDIEEQPVFLRKAFTMISSCPPEIGGWSENGDTVIVRDVKLFAETIIPTAYKHNNFSSFVRQLNFYGFRKVKSESLDNPTWWEFRHPNFLRGQPHLLSEIKRSVHFAPESASSKEVTDLKINVSSLTDRVASLHDQVEILSAAVKKLQLSSPSSPELEETDGNNKKRKTFTVSNRLSLVKPASDSSSSSSSSSYNDYEGIPLQRMTSADSSHMFALGEEGAGVPVGEQFADMPWDVDGMDVAPGNNDLVDEDAAMLCAILAPTPREPSSPSHSSSSSSSHLAMTPTHAHSPISMPPSMAQPVAQSVTAMAVEPMADMATLLESLSPELKVRFVDKLAEAFGAHLAANLGASHATAHHPESPSLGGRHAAFTLPGGSPAPEIALPLASATMSAFMQSLQSVKQNVPVPNVSEQVVRV